MNDLDIEAMMLDVAAGVNYLRQFPCVSKVVLLSLNPAISDEQTGAIDQALDLYAPASTTVAFFVEF